MNTEKEADIVGNREGILGIEISGSFQSRSN